MSVVVDSFPAIRSKYDWPLWADGRIHVLTAGVDFKTHPRRLTHAAHRHAEEHGLTVKTATRGDRVWLQFSTARGAGRPPVNPQVTGVDQQSSTAPSTACLPRLVRQAGR